VTVARAGQIPALFAGLFDDAALFPPGNAAMPAAITAHGSYSTAWFADLVGLFVCPAGRLTELAVAVAESPVTTMNISLTVPAGPGAVGAALTATRAHSRLRVGAVEVPVPAAGLHDALTVLSAGQPAAGLTDQVSSYVEVPVPDVTMSLCRELAEAGVALKLRTGGTVASAFPIAAVLGGALDAVVASGIQFKCTAGLHNAIAHQDSGTGFEHHGFLNVLLSIHDSFAGREAADALAERDAAAIAERVQSLSSTDADQIRSVFRSIGSCSIAEPLTDLEKAELVIAP
jgi:hypothetical protein